MRKITILTVLVVLANHFAIAQTNLPTPKNITATYAKKTRSEDGYPGKNYWQNTADYVININFNPSNRLLNGTEEITYFNNSNDTLHEIVFKFEPKSYYSGKKISTATSSLILLLVAAGAFFAYRNENKPTVTDNKL